MKSEFLKALEREIENFKFNFLTKYFKEATDVYWVADEVGGVLFVNDYFFSLQDMMDFIKYGYPVKKMFEYYDYRLLNVEQGGSPPYNIKNWIKLTNNK